MPPESTPVSAKAAGDNLAVDEALVLEMYRKMAQIRHCEDQLNGVFSKNLFPGYIHSYLGQEACAVGVCSVLRDEDYVLSTHRARGHYLAKGMALEPMVCEMLGKANGICGGRGGEMHAADPAHGVLGGNGIVGGGIPYATGVAYSSVLDGSDRVCVVFFGDGASNQGSFHEAMNLAAAWKLPLLFVCENNLYGEMTPFSQVTGQPEIAARAAGYGMPGEAVDGCDVLAVHHAARRAVARAQAGEGPTLLELKTYRYGGHFQGDPCNYRTREEEAQWRTRDPLVLLRAHILERKLATEADLDGWDEAAIAEVAAAVECALASPDPDPAEALSYVYAS